MNLLTYFTISQSRDGRNVHNQNMWPYEGAVAILNESGVAAQRYKTKSVRSAIEYGGSHALEAYPATMSGGGDPALS